MKVSGTAVGAAAQRAVESRKPPDQLGRLRFVFVARGLWIQFGNLNLAGFAWRFRGVGPPDPLAAPFSHWG